MYTYTARNKYTNQEQTFEEIHWLTKIQPSGQWILIRKNLVQESETSRGFTTQKTTPKVTAKKGCGRCGNK